MNELWSRWKIAIMMTSTALVAALVLMIAIRPSSPVVPQTTAPSTQAAKPSAVSTAVTAAPGPATASAPAPKPTSSSTTVWPTPKPVAGVTATWDPNFGDPFESEAGVRGSVREIVRVGAIRLGVTHASRVKNEAAVKTILTELGTEIDKREKGRTESFEVRLQEYQSVYEKFRPRLGEHMDGSFALKGDGWTDTEPLNIPPQAGPQPSAGVPHAH